MYVHLWPLSPSPKPILFGRTKINTFLYVVPIVEPDDVLVVEHGEEVEPLGLVNGGQLPRPRGQRDQIWVVNLDYFNETHNLYIYFNYTEIELQLRESAKKSSFLNGRAIKRGGG